MSNLGQKSIQEEIEDAITSAHPHIARGKVWCTQCGRSEKVNPQHCIRYGWPICCGVTMTIDNPAERGPR